MWPPPDWPEVRVSWDWIMGSHTHNPNDMFNWVDQQPGGRYHLHGYNAVDGFAYRFERPEDATLFALKWS